MTIYDVFNGDADGICALTQIRLSQPCSTELVTGVKRDIALLEKLDAKQGDQVTVLDISLDKNREPLKKVLEQGASVFYCDHHFAGEIPDNPKLTTLINTQPEVCTSILINQKLEGAYVAWAVVGAFGDNLSKSATKLAQPLSCSEDQLAQLKELGILINYNGYGASLDDLYFAPDELFKTVSQYQDPLQFVESETETFGVLREGYRDDMRQAEQSEKVVEDQTISVQLLPNEAWSRRVSGVYGNQLANQNPDRAHAVLTQLEEGGYTVSVRAPLSNRHGADEICRQFETGGGRAAAAGINRLAEAELDLFVKTLGEFYQQ